MFKVEVHINDKHMGELLKRLTGIAKVAGYNWVNNVDKVEDIKANGQVTTKATDAQELFLNELRKRGLDSFKADVAKDILGKIGYAPSSYHYFLDQAIKKGQLKKNGPRQMRTYSFKGAP